MRGARLSSGEHIGTLTLMSDPRVTPPTEPQPTTPSPNPQQPVPTEIPAAPSIEPIGIPDPGPGPGPNIEPLGEPGPSIPIGPQPTA